MATAGLTQAQQEIRSTGVGASEVAAVLGLSRYARPIDIAARKLRLIEEPEAGEPARWGNRLEQVIADAYAEEEGIAPEFLVAPGTIRHGDHPIVIATPDRLRLTSDGTRWDRNVQIKTASLRVAHRWGEGDDEVPDEYIVQVQWEMLATGLARTDLPVLIGGNEMRIYRLDADPELQGHILESVERFWRDYVAKGELPPPDGTPQWSEFLKRRFPRDERPLIAATEEARELISRLRDARGRREAAEAEEEQLKQKVQELIGDAAGIGGLCTWKCNRPSEKTDWEAIVRELPCSVPAGLLAKHTTLKPGARVFRLSNGKR
jgi:putative phage-type endonuclease